MEVAILRLNSERLDRVGHDKSAEKKPRVSTKTLIYVTVSAHEEFRHPYDSKYGLDRSVVQPVRTSLGVSHHVCVNSDPLVRRLEATFCQDTRRLPYTNAASVGELMSNILDGSNLKRR